MLLRSLLFSLLIVHSAHSFAYSCLEVADEFVGSSFDESLTYICLIAQEGYSNWQQLEKIHLTADITTVSLYDVVTSSSHCVAKGSPSARWTVQSGLFDLTCNQEFTLILSSQKPDFIGVYHHAAPQFVARNTLVVPQTGLWIRSKGCLDGDVGSVTFYSGVGTDENEHMFEMKSWPCSSLPDLIVSFDNVVTIEVAENVYEMECSSDIDRNIANLKPFMVSPGDRIAVLTSGRSDNLQNFKGAINAIALQLNDGQMYDVTASMDLTFDWSDTGAVWLQEYYGGPLVEFFGGKYIEYFHTNYLQVQYVPKGLSAAQIDASGDNIIVEITIGGGVPTIKSVPTTTAHPKTTSGALTTKAAPTTNAQPKTTPRATTSAPARTTALPIASTTASSSPPSEGPYCNCAVDKFGFPVGWNYNDIWLDVIFILDTSEAMGEDSLGDATALIESFISDGVNDFLITDPTAPYYTRVGVISMADTATVLFDLNMTKSDSLSGKAAINKGVSEIDVVDAFDVALRMFSNGNSADRVNTRKVIYYMTDSNPGANLNPINQFKTSQGIIIVDNFLEEGEIELPRLKELASVGYYFANSNYMEGLQAFCKANCFCSPNRDVYQGSDPAIAASGGCYHPSPAGVPFNKAKTNCMNDNGIIATVHDDDKGRYLQQLMAKSSSKSDYFWIGYEKSDAGVWQWEDQSANSYTNWDVNEPSTASVSKCAYVDTTHGYLPWGAGNCQIGFPYVCQYAPCSVGNKNC